MLLLNYLLTIDHVTACISHSNKSHSSAELLSLLGHCFGVCLFVFPYNLLIEANWTGWVFLKNKKISIPTKEALVFHQMWFLTWSYFYKMDIIYLSEKYILIIKKISDLS